MAEDNSVNFGELRVFYLPKIIYAYTYVRILFLFRNTNDSPNFINGQINILRMLHTYAYYMHELFSEMMQAYVVKNTYISGLCDI